MTRGSLSSITLGSAEENAVAHDLATIIDGSGDPWMREHFEKTLGERVDAAIGDTYGLSAAFQAEIALAKMQKQDRDSKQALSDSFAAAADKLQGARLFGLGAAALTVAAIYDTKGRRGGLAEKACEVILVADLSKSYNVAPIWYARTIAKVSRGVPKELQAKLFQHFYELLKAQSGNHNAMEHALDACLLFAQSPADREQAHREYLAGLELAAANEKTAIRKMWLLEDAMRVATEVLHDTKAAHRLAGVHRQIDPLPEMAHFGTDIDLEEPMKSFEAAFNEIQAELDLIKEPEYVFQGVAVYFNHVSWQAMKAPTNEGEKGIMDLLARKSISAADKTVKTPKLEQSHMSAIQRSMAGQIYDKQAMWVLGRLRAPLLVPLSQRLIEVNGDGRLPSEFQQLKPALEAYLRDDWYTAACLGAIALEGVMRSVCTTGGHPPHYYRDHATHNSLLATMVNDPSIEAVIGEPMALQLRYMESDDDGHNGRNTLLHANLLPRQVHVDLASRYIYTVLRLISALFYVQRQQTLQGAGGSEEE